VGFGPGTITQIIANCRLPIADLMAGASKTQPMGNRQLAINNVFEPVQKTS
jgi:hypothetical protein